MPGNQVAAKSTSTARMSWILGTTYPPAFILSVLACDGIVGITHVHLLAPQLRLP